MLALTDTPNGKGQPLVALDADQWASILVADIAARYRHKLVTVPGNECVWWVGAISGHSGHGRFWVGPNRVVIAHRFAYALIAGPEAASTVPILGHGCDNPLCQRVGPGHITASTARLNRREWATRRNLTGSPLGDPRGARQRATTLRDLAKTHPSALAAELDRLRDRTGEQILLWE